MRACNALYSAMPGVSRGMGRKRRIVRSGAGCHVGGEDVVRLAIEVLAGPVIPHCGAWIGVAGGELDVPQVHASVQHGRDEGMAEHVGMGTGDGHSGGVGQAP